MIVVCHVCKKDTTRYVFVNIGNDIKPLCSECKKLIKLKEDTLFAELNSMEKSFLDNEQCSLGRWIK
jgi:hypothetical protein